MQAAKPLKQKKTCFKLVGFPIDERCLVRPLNAIFQNLHGPQVRQNFPLSCFLTCSSSVPNSSDWNISPLAADDEEDEETDDEEDASTDDEREDGGVEGCGGVQGVAGLDPLGDGVPGNAAGEEGWGDTTGDVATDAATFADGSDDALADEDVE